MDTKLQIKHEWQTPQLFKLNDVSATLGGTVPHETEFICTNPSAPVYGELSTLYYATTSGGIVDNSTCGIL